MPSLSFQNIGSTYMSIWSYTCCRTACDATACAATLWVAIVWTAIVCSTVSICVHMCCIKKKIHKKKIKHFCTHLKTKFQLILKQQQQSGFYFDFSKMFVLLLQVIRITTFYAFLLLYFKFNFYGWLEEN